jgi:hypothetical protein
MADISFEQIAEEILKIKERMEALQAENEELRQQLTELRDGRGIFVDILSQRFSLRSETGIASEPDMISSAVTTAMVEEPAIPDTPTISIAEISLPETPYPIEAVDEEEEADAAEASPFLEEVLVAELTSAANTSAIWNEPETLKQAAIKRINAAQDIDEEQKAALRRALVGSFLLE